MSISDTKKNHTIKKNITAYLICTIAAFIITKVYGWFGHGVTSPVMTWMFLYPLLGGALVYYVLHLLLPQLDQAKEFRTVSNLYNSAIATLTVGSFLQGIVEIAGTSSTYIRSFQVVGAGFILSSLILLLWGRIKSTKTTPQANHD